MRMSSNLVVPSAVAILSTAPRRSGNVANHTKLFHLASQRHDPGAEPGGEATSQAGAVGKHRCRSPGSTGRSDVRSKTRSDGTACAGFGHGEAQRA
jgi:hypothetical protein